MTPSYPRLPKQKLNGYVGGRRVQSPPLFFISVASKRTEETSTRAVLHRVHRAEENGQIIVAGGLDEKKKAGIVTNGPEVLWDLGANRGITVGFERQ
jgi:hypothetical protein